MAKIRKHLTEQEIALYTQKYLAGSITPEESYVFFSAINDVLERMERSFQEVRTAHTDGVEIAKLQKLMASLKK